MEQTPQQVTSLKEGTRLWNDREVDKNLDDAWLESLNSLRMYDLISICEGHIGKNTRAASSFPDMHFRLKEQYVPLLAKDFDNMSNDLQLQMTRLLGEDDTWASLEYSIKLICSQVNPKIERVIVSTIRFKFARHTQDIDAETMLWFDKSVSNMQRFDIITESIMASKAHAAQM